MNSSSIEKNLVYISVLNHKNEPLFTMNLKDKENSKLSLEFQLMLFSSLDQFDIYSKKVLKKNRMGKPRAVFSPRTTLEMISTIPMVMYLDQE